MTAATFLGSEARQRAFKALKYLVYALLSFNIFLFLQEELLSLQYTFADGLELGNVVQVFSATIDTAAWVVLLLLFELETSVLDDSRIHGLTKWLLHGIRGICSVAIVYAFTGYCAELITLYSVQGLAELEPCSLVGQSWSLLIDLDEYLPMDAQSCAALGADAQRLSGFQILAAPDVLHSVRLLAWTDVINSAAWILVVIVLEVEVRLQLRGKLSQRIMGVTLLIKYIVYATLFAAALYWGYAGDFIDIWDATLWLVAFIFIELNVFEWQYETRHEDAAPV